jgi:hypothetical protein
MCSGRPLRGAAGFSFACAAGVFCRRTCPAGCGPKNCSRLARSLASPKILRLGIIKLTLASALDFSYFGFAENTPARQNANKFAFALGLFVSLEKIGFGSAMLK